LCIFVFVTGDEVYSFIPFFICIKRVNLRFITIIEYQMIKYFPLFALLLITNLLSAQTSSSTLSTELRWQQNKWKSETLTIPLNNPEPFIACSMLWEEAPTQPQIRFSNDGVQWTRWETLNMDTHLDQYDGHWVSELYFASKSAKFVQIQSDVDLGPVKANFFDPGRTPERATPENTTIETRDPSYCPCPQPDFEGRLDWCPDGSCPEDATPVNTTATHLIVHHSAGTNTSNDWAAVVRSIWNFHTGFNGWDDIGYNWLVDPNGVIYEGRGDGRLGAHFCGTNGGTMGVCVLGDFTNISPSQNAIAGLESLLAWKACDINVDPLGSAFHGSSGLTLNRISGHRDGCGTSCPGEMFYPQFPDLREGVVDYIGSSCAPIGVPQNLTATATSETAILLEWEDITDNETGFEVEVSDAFNGDYTLLTTVGVNVTSYEHTGLTPSTGYYYQVRAINDQDVSAYSNRAFAFTTIVNTDDLLDNASLEIFPNPAKEQLTIKWNQPVAGNIRFVLLNNIGQSVLETSSSGQLLQQQLSVEQYPNGIYWLKIESDTDLLSYKVVIQ
jgi:hypothetical protein